MSFWPQFLFPSKDIRTQQDCLHLPPQEVSTTNNILILLTVGSIYSSCVFFHHFICIIAFNHHKGSMKPVGWVVCCQLFFITTSF